MLRIENLLLRGDGAASQSTILGEASLWHGLCWRSDTGADPAVTRPSGGFKPGIAHAVGPGDSGVSGDGGHQETGLGELQPSIAFEQ